MSAHTALPPTEALSVLQRWGIAAGAEDITPGSGTANASAIIRAPGGRLMLRRRNPRYARVDWVRFDHALLAHLADDGLPVPHGVMGEVGRTWLRDGEEIYELFEFIDGEQHRAGDERQLQAAGQVLAKLHRSAAQFEPPVPKPWPRFHDPNGARDGLAELVVAATGDDTAVLQEALALAETLAVRLSDTDYEALPQTIVQGDYHPANLKFRGESVVGVFDWDWASRQPRMVDVADGLLFFCGVRDQALVAGDIWSLTAAFTIDQGRVETFLAGYQGEAALTDAERGALPDLMRCRWLFCRVDAAMRKVPEGRRVEFVTRELWRPLRGIDALEAKLSGV